MRVGLFVVGAVLLGLAALAVGWGIWLLATPDYQGARHFVGGATLTVGALVGLVGLVFALAARSES